MKIAIFAYSRRGCDTARQVSAFFQKEECDIYTIERLAEPDLQPIPKPSRPFYGERFHWVDALVFIGSCGIAVREIAPHVCNKQTDPAVLCVDELGSFVIPLLSGHIGGANDLALGLANWLDAVPVITTATDINGKFSVDAWAAGNGYVISSMKAAKTVSAAILEGNVPLCSDFPVATALPSGVIPGTTGEVGISVTCYTQEPFSETLRLIPKVLHLGIGCRRETEKETILQTVAQVLKENGIDHRAIKCAASIDLKAEEQGLLEFCRESSYPVSFYSAEALLAVEGAFTSSQFVQSITGVDNVCERAALIGAKELIVKKTAQNGVTVAVAAEHLEVCFG